MAWNRELLEAMHPNIIIIIIIWILLLKKTLKLNH